MKRISACLPLLCLLAVAPAELRLPQVFSDGMVLQRDLPVRVWGWAALAAPVTVAFAGQRVAAAADADGWWSVALDPLAAAAVRPGCIVSYSMDIAVSPGAGEQKLYANLCQNDSGSGYQAWGGTRTLSTAGTSFVTRTVVQRLTDAIADSHFCYPDAAGARFIFQGGEGEPPVNLYYVDRPISTQGG
jgi:hypothetical protein